MSEKPQFFGLQAKPLRRPQKRTEAAGGYPFPRNAGDGSGGRPEGRRDGSGVYRPSCDHTGPAGQGHARAPQPSEITHRKRLFVLPPPGGNIFEHSFSISLSFSPSTSSSFSPSFSLACCFGLLLLASGLLSVCYRFIPICFGFVFVCLGFVPSAYEKSSPSAASIIEFQLLL